MTTGETEETCGGQNEAVKTGEGNMKLPRSFTTLSTIAIQAGQSLIVVSVLKSGSLVHLQLVQVHPGLCEIGSNQEETQTLIQEQKQLMEKLKKHEVEVLSVVEKNQQTEQRRRRMRRRDEGTMEQKRNSKQEEEEEVHSAMAASLNEGWSLLLRLLQRRQEVLTLAADFYRRALEFAVGIDRVEDLQIRADNDRLTEVQLTYDSMRKDLLGKSLQVLTSSSVLLQKLRQLQKSEALQRRGGVLQDEEGEEEVDNSSQSSQCSRGTALRLEELVEALQDRRRRADQAVRLLLQQAENGNKKDPESREAGSEDWSLTDDEILDQDLQLGPDLEPESASAESTDLESDSRTEETRDLQSGSRSGLQPGPDVKPGSRSEETRDPQSGFRLNLKSESKSEETRDPQSGLRLNLKSESKSEETRVLDLGSRSDKTPGSRSELKSGPGVKPRSRSDLKSDSKSEETRNLQPESRLDLQSGPRSGLRPGSRSEPTRDPEPGFRLELKPGSRPEEIKYPQLGSRSDQTPGSRSELKPESKLDEKLESDGKSGSRSDETRISESGSRIELKPGPISEATRDLQSGSRSGQQPGPDVKPGSRSEETRDLQLGSRSDQTSRSELKPESKVDVKLESRSEPTRDEDSGSRPEETRIFESGSRLELKPGPVSEATRNLLSGFKLNRVAGSRPDLKSDSKSEETRDLQPESTSDQTPGSRSEPKPEPELDVKPESRSEQTTELQSGFKSDVQTGCGLDLTPASESEQTRDLDPGLRPDETRNLQSGPSGQVGGLESSGEGHAHQALLTNQRLQLLSSCEHLMDKICSWVQQSSNVLSNISEAGQQLLEAEDTLNTHLQLRTQAESASRDAETLKQILDQIRALHTSRTGPQPPSEPSRQLSPLKALTEQLKRGSTGGRTGTNDARLDPSAADPTGSLSPELIGRVDVVLKELQSLNGKIASNLQLLQPYVTFLRTAQQVEEEMEELREIYRRRLEEEEKEEVEAGRSPVKKKEQVDAFWQETLQRLLTCQELGDNYVHTVDMVSGAVLNLQSAVSVVQQTVERLGRTKQEVNELCSQQQIQVQQQREYCRKYQERLHKTVQDLNSVSEMLDSCTLMDLGSDLQTSKLLERFSQARPHFTRLDTEVEFMVKNWETLRGVQDRPEVEELKGGSVKEEHLSELLKLQERVKNKIRQSESILDLTSSFHLTSKQLEALLQSDPLTGSTGSCGSSEAEQQQQIQSLFKTASTLKTDICNAVNCTGRTCFRVEQLEARLLSLDSLCVSWLNEAARREEKLRRELLTRLLNDDINQLRDTFKELKKRFSNLRFNYLKRNDRTRNMKAVKNQLQQVEMYEEKLQALRKRLQGVTARLGSEVKDGGVAREAEDAINDLQRQMGEFERSVGEHQKTLEMTCRLQQAMEEYQFWCEDASATIARVGKFSSECRSTEAVSVLHRQFEKFVWPTVPQQEERISQITELAVRLHGAEEGRRYIEKTVSKHSEMVESIRELSDGLMELEAKLKLESLKQKQNDGEKEIQEEKETEEKDEEKEKKLKENRKMKKEKTDNRSTQEASDMYELKETGHTPELTTEHDGKEIPVKRQTAANRKPPLQKSRSQESDRQQLYSSTHTFSLSCSPVEANRRVHAIHSLLQPAATEPQATPSPSVIGPSFSDIQREFQRKEMQAVSASSGSNMTPLQDASAGGLSEAELQQQEVMTEDSLSNDEYDCASPDDISLPPLAETPESNMAQSDIEEGYCFSSHSAHINQYSHQSDRSGTGTGAVRQQRESSRTESCPPPTGLHNSTRFRSESSSFVQSPLTAPPPRLFTSTLCSILKTGKTSAVNTPQSADHCQDGPEPSFQTGPYPVHRSNTPDKDNDVPEKRSPSQTEPLLKEHNSQYSQPQRSTGTPGKITQNVASKGETLPQTDPIPQVAELNHNTTIPQSSYCPQSFNGPDPDLHKGKTPPQDTRFLKCRPTYSETRTSICQDNSFPQSFPFFKSDLHQDMNSSETRTETCPVSKLQRDSLINTNTNPSTSTTTQQTIYFQSSPSDSHHTLPQASSSLSSPQGSPLSQSETMPQIGPVPQARGFAESPSFTDPVLHKDRTRDTGLLKSCATCHQTTITLPQEGKLSQSYLDSRSGLDQDVPSSQTSKESSSVSVPQSSSLTTAITVKQAVYCQSSPPDSHCSVPQANRNPRSQQQSPFSQGSGGLPEVHASILPEPNSISNISISSSTITNSNRVSSKQSHQTVYSLHESLTSSCTQQCVHDPGMTPSSTAKPAAPPQPKPQTQALAQQANPHVTPLSSPPHLLTPDQDPSICQPMAIREEIKLTPQIQGPPLPAPPPLPQAQAESLPQGKASKPGPPCFTRPLSRATVMEGSPVTLEVEVTGHPDPTLTWCNDGELSCEDGKHFLFVPEASVSDGWLCEARAAEHHTSGGDKWLVAEVFDIISVDWQTWFGTLCVLLWLLYLILL